MALRQQNFHIGAKSLNYVKTEKFDQPAKNGKLICRKIWMWFHVEYVFSHDIVDGEFLSYAFGMVSDYIPLDLCEKLSAHLGLEKLKASVPGKRKSLIELEHNTLKRVKSQEDFSAANIETVSPPPAVQEKKTSAKQKQFAKAASGTKSISSFFTKK